MSIDIIVANLGCLQDLVEEGYCPLQNVSFVVLDEVDIMLDLGGLSKLFELLVARLGKVVKQLCLVQHGTSRLMSWPRSSWDQILLR